MQKRLALFKIIIMVRKILQILLQSFHLLFAEVSKLSEKIADLKSQLINVKDEQDFNINQLIKHRNDLKEKMDNIKEDMEFGLETDKEKLKSLALMSHQNYKVCELS